MLKTGWLLSTWFMYVQVKVSTEEKKTSAVKFLSSFQSVWAADAAVYDGPNPEIKYNLVIKSSRFTSKEKNVKNQVNSWFDCCTNWH